MWGWPHHPLGPMSGNLQPRGVCVTYAEYDRHIGSLDLRSPMGNLKNNILVVWGSTMVVETQDLSTASFQCPLSSVRGDENCVAGAVAAEAPGWDFLTLGCIYGSVHPAASRHLEASAADAAQTLDSSSPCGDCTLKPAAGPCNNYNALY